MFALPQIASERYVQRATPLKGSAESVVEAVAGRLFSQDILEALLAAVDALQPTGGNRRRFEYMSAFSKAADKGSYTLQRDHNVVLAVRGPEMGDQFERSRSVRQIIDGKTHATTQRPV